MNMMEEPEEHRPWGSKTKVFFKKLLHNFWIRGCQIFCRHLSVLRICHRQQSQNGSHTWKNRRGDRTKKWCGHAPHQCGKHTLASATAMLVQISALHRWCALVLAFRKGECLFSLNMWTCLRRDVPYRRGWASTNRYWAWSEISHTRWTSRGCLLRPFVGTRRSTGGILLPVGSTLLTPLI